MGTAFVSGHFGEWVQGCAGPGGEVRLVTLACAGRGVRARVEGAGALTLDDAAFLLDAGRARRFLGALGVVARGRVTLEADLPPGAGAGMSTAALVALARAACAPEDGLPDACLAAEGAVDPLMLAAPDAVLWAPRAARARADVPPPPAAEIVGGLWGAAHRTDPGDTGFPRVDDLIAGWMEGPDLARAAVLASLSAARTTALRGPAGDPTPALAARLGALGWARAHTGPARALIFSPGRVPEGVEAELRAAGYAHVLRFTTGGRS